MGISVNPRIQHAWAWNVCYKISCPSRNNKNDVLLILSENFVTWPNLVRIFCFQRAYLSSITKQLKKEQPDSGAGTRQKSAAKGEPTSLYQRCQIFPLTRDNLSHNVHTSTTQVMLWHNINQVWRSTVYSSTAAKKNVGMLSLCDYDFPSIQNKHFSCILLASAVDGYVV